MMNVKFKTKAKTAHLSGEFAVVGSRLRERMKRAVHVAALFIQSEAVKRAPIREGHLQASGHIVPETPSMTKSIYFDEPYAARMHEAQYNLGERSEMKRHHAGVMVGRKYLERAYGENRDKVDVIVRHETREGS